jgi:hypothetical protein
MTAVFRLIVLCLAVLASPGFSAAHGPAGKRFFPATLTIEDPFVADELSLPSVFHIKGYAGSQMTGDIGDTYDATAINAAAGVVWRLRRAARVETSLAFEVGSNHNVDKVTAAAGYAEVYGVVTLRIASF